MIPLEKVNQIVSDKAEDFGAFGWVELNVEFLRLVLFYNRANGRQRSDNSKLGDCEFKVG
jgi:hypothetical protein